MDKSEREKLRAIVQKVQDLAPDQPGGTAALVLKALDHIDALEGGLQEIFDFTTGYGDIAGIVNRMAHKVLSPDVFEAIASAQEVK